jgi:hypothetical protein
MPQSFATRVVAGACLLGCVLAGAHPARADYAEPPPLSPCPPGPGVGQPCRPQAGSSLVRVQTGPAVRLSADAPTGGLLAAIDVGRAGAGFRASAAWAGAGTTRGTSQFSAELWVDFGVGEALHPLVGAGAALVRADSADPASGRFRTSTLGAGVLRAGIAYVLPVEGADARAGIECTAAVPAIQDGGPQSARPWALIAATVGVGF